MTPSPTALAAWLPFFSMTAASAATLTGLMFVVVTLVSGERREQSRDGVGTFSTPTVVHFGAVLLISAIFCAPWPSVEPVAFVLAAAGIAGILQMIIVMIRAKRLTIYSPDAEDWTWYTVLPFVAYAGVSTGALLLLRTSTPALFTLASSVLLLVFIGIRNAWDVVTYLTITRSEKPDESK